MREADIKVICKRCGKTAKASEFVLDPIYRMVVCPFCVKERRTKENIWKEINAQRESQREAQKEAEKKPAGWDIEDEYLQKAHAEKMRNTVKVERIDDNKVHYQCPHCKYRFVYNLEKRMPARCPYCDTEIYKFRFV